MQESLLKKKFSQKNLPMPVVWLLIAVIVLTSIWRVPLPALADHWFNPGYQFRRTLTINGGLVTENEADSVTEVPLLGRIPVLGMLFQSSDRARTKSRVYAFIRPTILRDDQFTDLKIISETERDRASLPDRDYPGSEFLWMR